MKNLSFKVVQHIASSINSQPAPGNGVIVLVTGQLKADDDPPHHFSQVFHLLPAGDSYYVNNDIFSIILA